MDSLSFDLLKDSLIHDNEFIASIKKQVKGGSFLGSFDTFEQLISVCKNVAENDDYAYVIQKKEGIRNKYIYDGSDFILAYEDKEDVDDFYQCNKFFSGGDLTNEEKENVLKIFNSAGAIIAVDGDVVAILHAKYRPSSNVFIFIGTYVIGTTRRNIVATLDVNNNNHVSVVVN